MDIADTANEKQITYLDGWSTTVQKVMDLLNSSDLKKDVSDADDFYVFMYDEEEKFRQQKFKPKGKKVSMADEPVRVLGFWCFNAGVGFKKLEKLKPRSLIITSGTLSPMQSFEAELAVKFKHQVENPHVIDPKQVYISVLKRGINGQEFRFDYNNRENIDMNDDLAATIARIATRTPGGILIFFASYKVMNDLYDRWARTGLLREIEKSKQVFKEPQNAAEY